MRYNLIRTIVLIMCLPLADVLHASKLFTSAKRFTEHKIVTIITKQYLASKGYKISLRKNMGTDQIRSAILSHDIDFYWEYTGTGFLTFHKQIANRQSPDEVYETVKRKDESHGIIWLDRSKLNNSYAIAVRPDFDPPIRTISDLSDLINSDKPPIFACHFEFCRFEGEINGLSAIYNFTLKRDQRKVMDLRRVYQALNEKSVDIGLIFSSDSKVHGSSYTTLIDDKNYFTAFELTPVIRTDVLKKHPKLALHLNHLATFFNNKIMVDLNSQVDFHDRHVTKVAYRFLKSHGLLKK